MSRNHVRDRYPILAEVPRERVRTQEWRAVCPCSDRNRGQGGRSPQTVHCPAAGQPRGARFLSRELCPFPSHDQCMPGCSRPRNPQEDAQRVNTRRALWADRASRERALLGGHVGSVRRSQARPPPPRQGTCRPVAWKSCLALREKCPKMRLPFIGLSERPVDTIRMRHWNSLAGPPET